MEKMSTCSGVRLCSVLLVSRRLRSRVRWGIPVFVVASLVVVVGPRVVGPSLPSRANVQRAVLRNARRVRRHVVLLDAE